MALPASGQLSIADIQAISSRGSNGSDPQVTDMSLDWLADQILDTTPHGIADFYGQGADIVLDWSGSLTTISSTSTLTIIYDRLVITSGGSSVNTFRPRIRFNLSTSYTLQVYWKLNSTPTSGALGTLLTSGTQNTIWTIPATIGGADNLYITMYSSHPAGASGTWTNTVQSDGIIYGGLIDSFTASGTTSWSGGG